MRHARRDYDGLQDPTGKIAEDEPVFLLRAKDILAPGILLEWAERLRQEGGQIEMIELVRQHAEDMKAWQQINGCKLPDMPVG